jgi:hypothetical protein
MKATVLKISTLILSSLFFCLFILHGICQGQTVSSNPLLQKTVSVRMQDVYAAQVLEFLADEYHIPAGIEIAASAKTKGTKKKISIHVFQASLETALDAIVKADPRYRWEVVDGVVNLLPKDGAESLLGIRVGAFQVSNLNRLETKRVIAELPEVSSKLKSLGLEPAPISLWPNNKRDPLRLSIDLRNTTLRAILNEIAKKTTFWSISRFGEFFLVQI